MEAEERCLEAEEFCTEVKERGMEAEAFCTPVKERGLDVVLRNPVPGDIGWLISTHGRLYAEEFGLDGDFERDIAKKVLAFLEKPDPFNMIWFATVDGTRIGSIAVSLKPDQTAFINFLLVMTEFRGYGVARMLLDEVISHARDHGVGSISLETYSCLESARKLYARYGFGIATKNVAVSKYGKSFDQEFWSKDLGS
jgi:ribosomal protein S18 acetylase RimI-like enzyme